METITHAEFQQHKPKGQPIGEKKLPHQVLVRNPGHTDEEAFSEYLKNVLRRERFREGDKLWFRFGRGWTYCRFERANNVLTCFRQLFPKEEGGRAT